MNKSKLAISYIFMIMILSSLALASNMSINDPIDSFNYSYYNGSISIISSNDYMFDGNSNGLNDTLVINLTSSGSGSFNFIVKLVDSNNFYINVTTKTFSSSDSIQTNFPTELLLGNFFNYTVEITDLNNELVYRQYKTQTNKYKGYENGSSVIQMSDANIDNNWLRVVSISQLYEDCHC